MLRYVILSMFLLAGSAMLSLAAEASAICQQGAGKCTRGTSTTKPATSKPAAKKPPAKKAAKAGHDYTPEQRAKLMERAREVCRQKHGAPSRVYRVDFTHMRVWCLPPSY